MRVVARHAVTRFAGMEPGRPVGGTYYLYRTLRNLDLDGCSTGWWPRPGGARRGRGPHAARGAAGSATSTGPGSTELRQAVEPEIRRRLVEDRGAEALARSVRKPLPEDLDVMHATRDELATLQRALHPFRASWRCAWPASAATAGGGRSTSGPPSGARSRPAGVPVEPRFRHPRPAKPEILVVADISGSVASFARFTLHLVYAISSQFSKVRSFVFVDGIDEVTRFFERADDPAEAVHRINTEADVIWVDGHSDYGHALAVFHERWGDEVTTADERAGAGRRPEQLPRLGGLGARGSCGEQARHVYWLNPEPRDYWGSGDSIIDEYAAHCDAVVECRTLRQLERFVGDLE